MTVPYYHKSLVLVQMFRFIIYLLLLGKDKNNWKRSELALKSRAVSSNIAYAISKLLNMHVESIRDILISWGTKIFSGKRKVIKSINSKQLSKFPRILNLSQNIDTNSNLFLFTFI